MIRRGAYASMWTMVAFESRALRLDIAQATVGKAEDGTCRVLCVRRTRLLASVPRKKVRKTTYNIFGCKQIIECLYSRMT